MHLFCLSIRMCQPFQHPQFRCLMLSSQPWQAPVFQLSLPKRLPCTILKAVIQWQQHKLCQVIIPTSMPAPMAQAHSIHHIAIAEPRKQLFPFENAANQDSHPQLGHIPKEEEKSSLFARKRVRTQYRGNPMLSQEEGFSTQQKTEHELDLVESPY